MEFTQNYSCEDINQILLDNLKESEGITLNDSNGKQLNGTDDFADEIEKTRENTRQLLNNPEQSDIPYYFRGEQIYESNFADETETLEETRQLLNNLEQHLNNLFKGPIVNQETQ